MLNLSINALILLLTGLNLKSLLNRYHHLILDVKKQYLSKLVSSSSDHPPNLWKTVNKLVNGKYASPLSSSAVAATSIAYQFAHFFTDKISRLRLSLANNSSPTSPLLHTHIHHW